MTKPTMKQATIAANAILEPWQKLTQPGVKGLRQPTPTDRADTLLYLVPYLGKAPLEVIVGWARSATMAYAREPKALTILRRAAKRRLAKLRSDAKRARALARAKR